MSEFHFLEQSLSENPNHVLVVGRLYNGLKFKKGPPTFTVNSNAQFQNSCFLNEVF